MTRLVFQKTLSQNLIKLGKKSYFHTKNPYIDELEDFLLNSFTANDNKLNDICLSQLNYLCKKLKIDTNIIKESEIMSVEDTKKNNASERLLSHAKLTNANIYITGTNSKNYLDESLFKKNNINHIVQKFDYDYFAVNKIALNHYQ